MSGERRDPDPEGEVEFCRTVLARAIELELLNPGSIATTHIAYWQGRLDAAKRILGGKHG
jgi:hypothetical protein